MFTEFATWLQDTPASQTIQTVTWIIPLLQSIHIVTIGIVFVSILLVALRVLGVARADEGLGEVLQRFSPWIGIGLIVMAVTGSLLVVGEPIREFSALSFWLKMTLLVVAVTSGEIFRRSLRGASSGDGTAAYSSKLKAAAVVTVAIWVCIIYLGRTIAYDVEIWGSLSFNS
jgi:putative copper export protein